jgi:cellobiose transport system substrate-binding protein
VAAGLYDAYMKLHPNITIVATAPENETDYWTAVQTKIAGGTGLGDVQAIEVGRIAGVVANQAANWVDLNTFSDASTVEADFLPWKLAFATTSDKKLLAMGTDIGPISMCYKPALLKAAGLPTDAASLEALMPNWDAYVAVGKQYASKLPSGAKWTDTGSGLFRAAMGSAGAKYTDATGKIIYATNATVKSSWNLAVNAVQSGLTTKLAQFSTDWNKAFSTPTFATIPCPSWMLAYIKGQAGTAGSGQWSVMKSPGAGNVGGAYIAIPATSQHKAEAWDLIKFLTSADSEAQVFQKAGNFPSNIKAEAEVKDYADPYFNNSPVGALYGASAAAIPTQAIGPHDNDIEGAIMNGLVEIAQKGTAPDAAWTEVVNNINAAIGG